MRSALIVCTVKGCTRIYEPGHPRAGRRIPFKSQGALGSHRRRAHGLAAMGSKPRRTPGTRFACDYPNCLEAPYNSLSGLGSHKNKAHGVVSESAAAVAKADYRSRKNPAPRPVPGYVPPEAAPPRGSFEPFQPNPKRTPRGLTRGTREYIRLQLLYLVNGNWAKAANATPAEIRDYVAHLCQANFAPPKHKTARVATVNAYSRK